MPQKTTSAEIHVNKEESAQERWSRLTPITNGDEYVGSLRDRNLTVHLMGDVIDEPVDHAIIRPSINVLKMTYDLAQAQRIQMARGMDVERKKLR